MKNRSACSRKPHGATAIRDLGENRVNLTGNKLVDGSEADAIFVAEGEVAQQITNGQDAALLQDCSAMRPDPAQIFHRVFESDGQENFWRGAAARHFYIIASRRTLADNQGARSTPTCNFLELLWRARCNTLDLNRTAFHRPVANLSRHNALKRFSITECCGSRGKCPILGKHRLTMLTFDRRTRLFS